MNEFLLRPLNGVGRVTDEQVDQLRLISGVRISRVLTYIVAVSFDGEAAALQALLAGTGWDPDHVGKCRTYRTQGGMAGPALGLASVITDGPQLRDVLMQFAIEKSLPTRAHLYRYLEAFPQFRQELIGFAVSLVEDHFHPEPVDAGKTD
ncbi:hypothetical protein [Paraburkholderia fungorum]|uniref:Uncharacterized protein n=1 Tax=Paraburkholderia fungorum TaxID=134537 RepID=A0AAW3V4B6_9BURK|nr:hypothetical protein [Paraburkholderia fungorum]MBB4517434.1 hypothetical protein [Paraburkholderia fungorum]MBB6204502.1 hypothetical protein [Paraburkholderia fungorum]